MQKPQIVKALARLCSSTVPVGTTKFDPQVKVHENAVFLFKSANPQKAQRIMYFDYAFVLAAITMFAPSIFNGFALFMPLAVFFVKNIFNCLEKHFYFSCRKYCYSC